MAIPGSANLLLAGSAQAYQIEQSLRFDGSSYLRLPAPGSGSASDTHTFSWWYKKPWQENANPGVVLWNRGGSGLPQTAYYIDGVARWTYASLPAYYSNQGSLRDVSAWYHFMITRSGSTIKMYQNGVELTPLNTSTYPSSQANAAFGNYQVWIGCLTDSSGNPNSFFEGYMAEVHAVNGSALDPEDFGEFDGNGVWRPIEVTGLTYGTNGFYLKFDPTATNGIGHDHSGNGNHFTATGFTTSGGFTDVMSDTPTNNYPTINPLANISGLSGTISSITEGNLKLTSNGNTTLPTTIAIPAGLGKWYWEATVNTSQASSNWIWGLQRADVHPANYTNWANVRVRGVYLITSGGAGNQTWIYGSNSYTASSWTISAGDVLGFALDATTGNFYYYLNGVLKDTFSSTVDTSLPHYPAGSGYATSDVATWNFGQREFAYPPGTSSATEYFNTVTWTGNGSTQSITGVGFQPDFVWTKKRSGNQDHFLFDVVRGSSNGNFYELRSSSTTSQGTPGTASTGLTSFNTDGFSVGSDGSVNTNNDTYVAWCWKAGGTPSSNTDGSQTASVSANDAAGFSVMTWNYSGSSSYTVGHGLSTAPKVLFVKKTDGSTNWFVRHGAIHSGNGALFLNSYTTGDSGSTVFNGTAPTNSVISLNGAITDVRGAHVCYAFAEKAGVSKFGSYTGNGSVDGPEINDLGFAPALLVIKRTDSSSEWAVYDSARGNDNQLRWDQIDAQNTNSAVNVRLTRSGFKIATADPAQNSNGGNYIYMAWARNFSADANYKELNTANLPAPDIADGSQYMNTVTWTGTGASRTIDFGMQPDWIWAKGRNTAANHRMSDNVRGGDGTTFYNLCTNNTTVENTDTVINGITSTGVTFKNVNDHPNISGSTYVGWGWKANGSGSSNTAGTITSTVSANPSAGFSIVSYASGASGQKTVGHGLGVAPDMIITKSRDGSTFNWAVFHSAVCDTTSKYLKLNTDGLSTSSTIWGAALPTSTVFGITSGGGVEANDNCIAYCFAEVEGYSKFGSYTGNGSTDGPFVYCGFKPAFVMIKVTNLGTTSWMMRDDKRDTDNPNSAYLLPNSSLQEYTNLDFDFLSNGFKPRHTNNVENASGYNYVFAAFASSPFGGDGVSPATAR